MIGQHQEAQEEKSENVLVQLKIKLHHPLKNQEAQHLWVHLRMTQLKRYLK